MKRLALLAALSLAACHKSQTAPPAGGPPVVTVLATGDVWGQVEPCG